MPMRECLPVTVTLLVEVDGHRLTFEETGDATGPRWHGEDPHVSAYSTKPGDTLEANIRGTVDTCTARAARRAETFLRRAYPVHGDTAEEQQP